MPTPEQTEHRQRNADEPQEVLLHGRRTLIDADVLAPLSWGPDDQRQFEQLDAIRGAGL